MSLFFAQEVKEGGENEQGGRVYAFSPSLLIINVSQVHKIASCSFHSILPSSSLSLRGSPSSRPICLLPLPPLVLGYLSISVSLHTHYSCHRRDSSKANALWRVKQAKSIQRRCSLGAVSPDHRCGQSHAAITTGAMSSPHQKFGTGVNENFRSAKQLRYPYCRCC